MATKKDYIQTAGILRLAIAEAPSADGGAAMNTLTVLAGDFAAMYERERSQFNRAKFLKACGV